MRWNERTLGSSMKNFAGQGRILGHCYRRGKNFLSAGRRRRENGKMPRFLRELKMLHACYPERREGSHFAAA
jgi:hypothetical protein